MGFKGSQKRFKELVGSEDIDFCYDINIHGVHIEHGHRFEVINTVPPEKTFMMGPNNKEILNLPWGSLFCISVLPQLKKERPFIDKVRQDIQRISSNEMDVSVFIDKVVEYGSL